MVVKKIIPPPPFFEGTFIPFFEGARAEFDVSIPASMRHRKKDFFEYGKCDESARPGSGSKLYYINSWAMCWPSYHAKKPLTG